MIIQVRSIHFRSASPNILSGFSNSQTFGVYSNGSSKQRIVYNSTFNIRAAYVKFFTLLSMIATYFCDFEDNYGTFAILGWINPDHRTRRGIHHSRTRAMSREVIVTQLSYLHHIGGHLLCGSFRLLWALGKLLTRSKGWTTYESLATRPWAASKPSVCAVAWNSSSRRQYSASFYGR
jgi:hypothetical protein